MALQYKGVIKMLSKPNKKWAVVKEYKDAAKGVSNISNAFVMSTVAPISAVSGTITSTAAPNASAQLTATTSTYNVNITVDGTTINLDCTGDAGASGTYSVASIIARINTAFGKTVATSTGTGASTRIVITGSALMGTVSVAAGTTNSGLTNIFGGALSNTGTAERFNLSSVYNVRITHNGGSATTVNMQGATPATTTMDEIITKINTALGATIASKVGSGNNARIKLQSTSSKSDSYIKVESGSSQDALSAVFAATALSDTGNSYESTFSYKVVKSSGLSSKSIGNTIEYVYTYGNNITIL